MRLRFVGSGDPDEATETVAFGHTFVRGEWVDAADLPSKLLTNPAFETDADGDGEAGPSVDELRAKLDGLGVKYHPRSGISKLAEQLAEAEGAGA